ncbi:MAG: glycosyl hydrolase family 18 protein [Candidatus Dormibacteraeota bacterium]|nr:glycosyl hydrolase family 18 protein [Candidatus Dormibacteraeota bacterium]
MAQGRIAVQLVPADTPADMRLGGFLALCGVTAGSLLMTGLPSTNQIPAQGVRLRALHLDGRPVPVPASIRVSTRPQLVVEVDRLVRPDDWSLTLDHRPVSLGIAGPPVRGFHLALPGPLPMGSAHHLVIAAGSLRVNAVFAVVPPLTATVAMRPHDLQIGRAVTVAATVHFSRPVADRGHAVSHVWMDGHPTFTWRDSQTVEAIAGGFHLSDQVSMHVGAGVAAADGSFSTSPAGATLTIPPTITTVLPGRMVQMYYVNTPDGRDSFMSHLRQIDVLSPSWYDANADGTITGYAHQDVIDAAHANGVAIIPLVVNANVDPDVGHAIIADPGRRATLAGNLVAEARRYGYAGFQLDFEQIRSIDRDLLTALVKDCATAFHAAGLNLSIAVIPRLPGDATATGVLGDYFRTWSGAYDFRGLAASADFLSFMTYDEHNGVTPAGPVSGTPWMRQALDYSLQGVAPEKATLGLPTYYHDWTGVGRLTSSSYADAMVLAQSNGATPTLDAAEDEMHFGYDAYGTHHELWIQSTETLRRKLPLVYEYGLKGISVWRLGFEDPSFWSLIPPRH